MATTKPSDLRAYIDQLDDVPADLLLGRLVLFTISEEQIRRDDLVKWFAELGLDEKYLPMENKAVDAFKKATSDTKDSYELSRGRTAYLMCRDVTSNSDYIKRQITREIKDGDKRRLDYDSGLGAGGEAIGITFYRATKIDDQNSARLSVSVNPRLPTEEQAPVRTIAQEIYTRYENYRQFMDSAKIRAMVRNYLKKLNAIEVKGGVYFVHSSKDEELTRLSELVNRLGGDCAMNQIPMLDLQRERAFVVRTFEREAAQSLNDLSKEIREAEAKGSITPAAYGRLKARFDQVVANAEEHTLTLQISQDSTTASAEVALNALTALQNRMVSE